MKKRISLFALILVLAFSVCAYGSSLNVSQPTLYGELYENNTNGGTDIVRVVPGQYYQWVSSTVGATSGAGYVVGSASTDNLTIGQYGEGDYLTTFHVSGESQQGVCNDWAIFKNNAITNILSRATSPHPRIITTAGSNLVVGSLITGTYASTADTDSIYHQIEENNSTPAIDIRYYYTDPEELADINIFGGRYFGSASHHLDLQPLDVTTVVDSGTSESGGNDTITDTDQAWDTDEFEDFLVVTIGGTGSGQEKRISSNDSDTLTVESNWSTNPDDTTTYEVRGEWIDYGVTEDIPNAPKVDFIRKVKITGTLADYYDSSSRIVWRLLHPDAGNVNHDLYTDFSAISDDKSVTHTSSNGILTGLVNGDTIDLRVSCNIAGSIVTTKNIRLEMTRLNE